MANGSVPPAIVRGLTAALATAAVIGFAILSIYGFVKTFQASKSAPTLNEAYLYVTAAMSALVGGVVAVAFGQKPSPDPPAPNLLRANLTSLTRVATGTHPSAAGVGAIIGSVYAIAYVVLGIAAVVIWIIKPDLAADPVKALASTFIGLAIPIVRSFFN